MWHVVIVLGESSISGGKGGARQGKHPLQLEPAPSASSKRARSAESQGASSTGSTTLQKLKGTRRELFAAEKGMPNNKGPGLSKDGRSGEREGRGLLKPSSERARWSEEERQRVAQLLVSDESLQAYIQCHYCNLSQTTVVLMTSVAMQICYKFCLLLVQDYSDLEQHSVTSSASVMSNIDWEQVDRILDS